MVRVGRDLCGSSSPTLLPKQGHLQQAAKDLVQGSAAKGQGKRLMKNQLHPRSCKEPTKSLHERQMTPKHVTHGNWPTTLLISMLPAWLTATSMLDNVNRCTRRTTKSGCASGSPPTPSGWAVLPAADAYPLMLSWASWPWYIQDVV